MSTDLSSNIPLEDCFVTVTPAGCYYTVESSDPSVQRQLLHRLLSAPTSPPLSHYEGIDKETITELHAAGFVIFSDLQKSLPEGNLLALLPQVLPALSELERVVLTESLQGLYLEYSGVSKEEAEELAVIAAGFRELSEKRSALIEDQLSITSRAFGIIDPAGNSEIGFWPLHVSNEVFTLIVLGIPRFNTTEFCTLVWALIERYGQNSDEM